MTVNVVAKPRPFWQQRCLLVTCTAMNGDILCEVDAPWGADVAWLRGRVAEMLVMPLTGVQFVLPCAKLLQDHEFLVDLASDSQIAAGETP